MQHKVVYAKVIKQVLLLIKIVKNSATVSQLNKSSVPHNLLHKLGKDGTLHGFCKVVGCHVLGWNIDEVDHLDSDVIGDPKFSNLNEPGGLCS